MLSLVFLCSFVLAGNSAIENLCIIISGFFLYSFFFFLSFFLLLLSTFLCFFPVYIMLFLLFLFCTVYNYYTSLLFSLCLLLLLIRIEPPYFQILFSLQSPVLFCFIVLYSCVVFQVFLLLLVYLYYLCDVVLTGESAFG